MAGKIAVCTTSVSTKCKYIAGLIVVDRCLLGKTLDGCYRN